VLETPVPDEDVCGCARLKFRESGILVDVLAAIGSEDVTKTIAKSLLQRIDLIARSFNLATVSVEVSSNLSEQLAYLGELGFIESSGYYAPRDEAAGRANDTMVQIFSKSLQHNIPPANIVVVESVSAAIEAFPGIGDLAFEIDSSDTAPENISALVENLFTALHSEYPDDQS